MPSIVEAVINGVANGIMYLLNGDTTASKIARHAIKISIFKDPSKISTDFGTINRALAFLSGYSIYVCTSTDRFVCRKLHAHAIIHRFKGHPLIGGFDATKFSKAQMYCRVCKYANTIRMAMVKITELGIPQDKWSKIRTWTKCLPGDNALSDSTCANLDKQPLQIAEVIGITTAICVNVNTNHNCQKNGAMMLGLWTNAAVLTNETNT